MFSARFIPGIETGASLEFTYQGQTMQGFQGETIASALMRAGVIAVRSTPRLRESRGYYCGMGICWDCAVFVDGEGVVRGCSFPVSGGLSVREAVAITDESA
jgi:ferredoxin